MSQTPCERLRAARTLLGITVEQARNPEELRRAYRRLLAGSPPDRDPTGFRALRSAYELLSAPVEPIRDELERPVPGLAPPSLDEGPAPPPVRGATAVAILRAAVAELDASVLAPERTS